MIGHIIGIDSAGHSFDMRHKDISRKIRDTDRLIGSVVEKMDDKTTLIVFGDHGMTEDGNHGGSTQMEMATVIMAY
jgi:phosphatidylinositol glycan class O